MISGRGVSYLKKIGFALIVAVVVMVAVAILVYKSYTPPLPIENVTAKEVMKKLEESDCKVVEIRAEEDVIWYITRAEKDGIQEANRNIKEMISSDGWEFKEKNGAGIFFEKNGERLIVTTQMWGKKYVLVKVESKFKNHSTAMHVSK